MHKNNIAHLLALTMVAATLAPMAAADPGVYDHYEDTQAPAGIYAKDLASLALAFCFLDPTLPFSCDPNPGNIPALGGAFFDVSAWNNETGAAASYGRQVRINVEHIDGPILGGFALFACTDYNDDIECDSGDWGQSDDDCNTPVKDKKDCGDPIDAETIFCAEKDDYTFTQIDPDTGMITTETDDMYDDFVVFITWWLDVADNDAGGTGLLANPKDSTDFGLSSGTFRVYADWSTFMDKEACDAANLYNHIDPTIETGVVVEHA